MTQKTIDNSKEEMFYCDCGLQINPYDFLTNDHFWKYVKHHLKDHRMD